jgi:hypothetical protein
MPDVIITEPVEMYWRMAAFGDVPAMGHGTRFASIAEARHEGRLNACLNGTESVTIVGADGALLCSYERVDNIWNDLCRGELTVTDAEQVCTCGGVPTVAIDKPMQHEKTMGWFWSCDRCGAFTWSHVDPRATACAPYAGDR